MTSLFFFPSLENIPDSSIKSYWSFVEEYQGRLDSPTDVQERKAFYAGTFDPPHMGHIQLVEDALKEFDFVVIGIGVNPEKTPHLNLDERKLIWEKIMNEKGWQEVKVISYTGLTVEAAAKEGCGTLLRGIRNDTDLVHS